MGGESIENLIRRAKENPEELKSESDALAAEVAEKFPFIKLFTESSGRFAGEWNQYENLRKSVEESLSSAKKIYKETLKKTEASAQHGQPKLYWLAKALFARLRKQSLEFQIRESEIKIESLNRVKADLKQILSKMNSTSGSNCDFEQLASDTNFADSVSKRHAVDLQVEWERCENAFSKNEELVEKRELAEIEQSVAEALVSEVKSTAFLGSSSAAVRKIDSPRMMVSRLAHVGFSNRPRLMMLIERSEYAARHAEGDLDKVREGLKLAADAAVDGRATSLSREWIDYCRTIVARYEVLAEPDVTPR
jgi:hypothetical protein